MSAACCPIVAAAFDSLYGAAPNVVETQGQYLQKRPSTPVVSKRMDYDAFATDLDRRLQLAMFVQRLRRKKYGVDIADEWPAGHTPCNIVGDYEARVSKTIIELETPTPPDSLESLEEWKPIVDKPGRFDLNFSTNMISPGLLDLSAPVSQPLSAPYSASYQGSVSTNGKFPFMLAKGRKRTPSTTDLGDRSTKCRPLGPSFMDRTANMRCSEAK